MKRFEIGSELLTSSDALEMQWFITSKYLKDTTLHIHMTVVATRSRINDSFTEKTFSDKTCCFPSSTLPGQLKYGAAIIGWSSRKTVPNVWIEYPHNGAGYRKVDSLRSLKADLGHGSLGIGKNGSSDHLVGSSSYLGKHYPVWDNITYSAINQS